MGGVVAPIGDQHIREAIIRALGEILDHDPTDSRIIAVHIETKKLLGRFPVTALQHNLTKNPWILGGKNQSRPELSDTAFCNTCKIPVSSIAGVGGQPGI